MATQPISKEALAYLRAHLEDPASNRSNRADSWHDAADDKSVMAESKACTTVARAPIPQHLLRGASSGNSRAMNARSTQPVGNRGRGRKREKGWKDITAGDAVNYGKKAWQLAKHLATLINVEDKKFDIDGSGGTTISTTATVVNLTNIAQGTDYFNRAGDSILGQNLEFRAWILSSGSKAYHLVRVMIVVDRENHGVDPVIGEILQGGTSPLVQPMLATAANRFEVLYDELVTINSPSPGLATTGTSTDYVATTVIIPSLLRKWNKHVKYTSTAGADASNWENAMFLYAIGDNSAMGPSLKYTWRFHFTDN